METCFCLHFILCNWELYFKNNVFISLEFNGVFLSINPFAGCKLVIDTRIDTTLIITILHIHFICPSKYAFTANIRGVKQNATNQIWKIGYFNKNLLFLKQLQNTYSYIRKSVFT